MTFYYVYSFRLGPGGSYNVYTSYYLIIDAYLQVDLSSTYENDLIHFLLHAQPFFSSIIL